jgi:hypothetical protein
MHQPLANTEPVQNGSSTGLIFGDKSLPSGNRKSNKSLASPLDQQRHYAVYRDPGDVHTIRLLTWISFFLTVIVFGLSANTFYLYTRKPDRIVVDRTSQGEVILDNRKFGQTSGVSISPDNPTVEDKLSLAKKWMTIFNEIDPEVRLRKQSLQQVLGAMVPQAAAEMGNWLKSSGTASRERDEAWSSTFEIQTAEPVSKDTIRVLGTMTLKKVVNGTPLSERIQIEWKISVTPDPSGRKDRNFNTGYLVTGYTDRVISRESLPNSENENRPVTPKQ